MKTLGVISFVVGVAAMGMLVLRRSNGAPMASRDSMLMFIGVAGVISGLALFFIYALQV